MRLLVYTVLRLALVLAAAGVLHVAGMRSWALWAAALVVAALVSFLVLGKQRDAAAQVLAEHDPLRRAGPRFSPAVEADAAYEDAVVDAGDAPAAGPVPGEPAVAGTAADGLPADRTGSTSADLPPGPHGAADETVRHDEPPVTGRGAPSEREPQPEQDSVAQLQQAGVAQDDDEVAPGGAA